MRFLTMPRQCGKTTEAILMAVHEGWFLLVAKHHKQYVEARAEELGVRVIALTLSDIQHDLSKNNRIPVVVDSYDIVFRDLMDDVWCIDDDCNCDDFSDLLYDYNFAKCVKKDAELYLPIKIKAMTATGPFGEHKWSTNKSGEYTSRIGCE